MIYLKILTKLRKYLLCKYQQICITRHTCLIKCKYLKNPYRSQFDFWHADSSLCEEQKYLKFFFSRVGVLGSCKVKVTTKDNFFIFIDTFKI